MTNSIWNKDINRKNDKLEKLNDLDLDVLIIGGGLAGISTAFYLKDSNLNVALIESNKIGSGTTSLTTGKIW